MVLDEILGGKSGVTGTRLKGTCENGGRTEEIRLTGAFVAIGHKPNTDIFRSQLDMNDAGYIRTKSGLNGVVTTTSIPGVSTAGDM